MKKLVIYGMMLAMLGLLSGCMIVASPVAGGLFTDVKAPLTADAGAASGKVGTATAKSILGLVALGDASIDAAMKAGGIRRVNHVDYHSKSILGIYGEFTVTVYGE